MWGGGLGVTLPFFILFALFTKKWKVWKPLLQNVAYNVFEFPLNDLCAYVASCRAFIITAVAQLCILGIMWIFGCFQFEKSTIAMSYLFTIFGSFQGVLLFVMHCLFSKQVSFDVNKSDTSSIIFLDIWTQFAFWFQVREEYANIWSRCSAPGKRKYSEFSYSHSSKAQVRKNSFYLWWISLKILSQWGDEIYSSFRERAKLAF